MTSFRSDLASVSADIESLQARSTHLNTRLENRLAVEKALGPIVEELSVPPMVVSKISDGPIDDSWVKFISEIDKRVTSYRAISSNPRPNKSWAELGPLLENLVLKVCKPKFS